MIRRSFLIKSLRSLRCLSSVHQQIWLFQAGNHDILLLVYVSVFMLLKTLWKITKGKNCASGYKGNVSFECHQARLCKSFRSHPTGLSALLFNIPSYYQNQRKRGPVLFKNYSGTKESNKVNLIVLT